jgi:hypothetical protein|nr:MAG TPA: major capsid protein [Caudoviricetes sp.]
MSKIYGADAKSKALGFDEAAIGAGMAFLNGELEKRNVKLNEPLTSFTYARDISIETGGGLFTENVSNIFVDYASVGGNEEDVVRNTTSDIATIQTDVNKEKVPSFIWMRNMTIGFIDQKKMAETGRGLDELLNKGIKLAYNKALDLRVYEGMNNGKYYGLVNNPKIPAVTASASAGDGNSTKWKDKLPDEILDDINQAMQKTWENSEYDLKGMCNQILVDPSNYTYLVSRKVSDAGNISILSYLLENNIGKNQGIDLVIAPCRWCAGAGTGSTNRMVCYANDSDMVNIAIPQPLTKTMTTPEASKVRYVINFAANFSVVNFKYLQHAMYVDGI